MKSTIGAVAIIAITVSVAPEARAQAFLDQPCSITSITFDFALNQTHRTVQNFSGQGCSASFRGGLGASYESISVVQRAKHLTITPTSNGFGFTVAKRTRDYRGPDSYTLRICGRNNGPRGCVTITYNVTVQ